MLQAIRVISSRVGLKHLNPWSKMFIRINLAYEISFLNRFNEFKPKLWAQDQTGIKTGLSRSNPVEPVRK